MNAKKSRTIGAAALILASAAAVGCGSSSMGAQAPSTSAGSTESVAVANGALGQILTDAQGRTLYLFERDSGPTSTCSGACATEWPPLRAAGTPTTGGSGVDVSAVATSRREDGAPQITYDGHPLYLFAGDDGPGQTDGQGVNAFGGLWYVVAPSGEAVTTPTPTGSTPGY